MLKLRVRLTSNPEGSNESEWPTFWFDQEAGKKASFSLESSKETSLKVEKPCHLLVDCFPSSVSGSPWLFGGMEIFSNSRNIEVYAIPEGKDKGEYWQTYRGSRVVSDAEDDDGAAHSSESKDSCETEVYQATILPPSSKPQKIVKLQIKLLSLRPARCSVGFVKSMKLKGRLPDVIESDRSLSDGGTPADVGPPTNVQPVKDPVTDKVPPTRTVHQVPLVQQQAQMMQQPHSQTEQISAAVAGLTMMIQNIHGSMEKSIENTVGEVQKLAFAQNEKIADLEKSVNKLSDSVESLVTEMKLLREQNTTIPQAIVKNKSLDTLNKNEEPVIESVAVENIISVDSDETGKHN